MSKHVLLTSPGLVLMVMSLLSSVFTALFIPHKLSYTSMSSFIARSRPGKICSDKMIIEKGMDFNPKASLYMSLEDWLLLLMMLLMLMMMIFYRVFGRLHAPSPPSG